MRCWPPTWKFRATPLLTMVSMCWEEEFSYSPKRHPYRLSKHCVKQIDSFYPTFPFKKSDGKHIHQQLSKYCWVFFECCNDISESNERFDVVYKNEPFLWNDFFENEKVWMKNIPYICEVCFEDVVALEHIVGFFKISSVNALLAM